jgi:hypothetical protein
VLGMPRVVGVSEVQVLQTTGVSYAFVGWSDGGAREHVFTPVSPGANNSLVRQVQTAV